MIVISGKWCVVAILTRIVTIAHLQDIATRIATMTHLQDITIASKKQAKIERVNKKI